MNLNHVLHYLGFPEEDIPDLLEEAKSYDPVILERAFSGDIMECLSSGCAKKMLGTGLSSSFVFHLAVLDANCLTSCPILEIFRTVLGSDWVDVLNENHKHFTFGDDRVYDLLDRMNLNHDQLIPEITDLCDVIRLELDDLAEEEDE